jgi:nicotinamide-nucleotide amidase
MEQLLSRAREIALLLKSRNETISIAESASGGLVSAALLAVPGASAYFTGGAVVYTRKAAMQLLQVSEAKLKELKPSSAESALFRAQRVREQLATTWGVSESGVAGPTGSRYGHPPGYTCIAVSGPVERTVTVDTGRDDRVENMYAFSAAALDLLADVLRDAQRE